MAVQSQILLLWSGRPAGPDVVQGVPDVLSLGPEDDAHLGRFSDPKARQVRRQGRALLVAGLRHLALPHEHLRLTATTLGAPIVNVPGVAVSFSYTEDRACCLIAVASQTIRAGVDWETLRTDALPPASTFAPQEAEALRELSALAPSAAAREALRRFSVCEALGKAHGTGLRVNPKRLRTGSTGCRSGRTVLEGTCYAWRCLPFPGSWICLAIENDQADLLAAMRVLRVD